ncbi:ABC transporter ATP-binding protein [Fusibacter sp. 3D3]|uniref:ABC transporter ATP-binding protein n=1 Tax=Fusibacter sp. 3D3 TaxID=1048380 RepID=UPI000852F261|nr:ABC transporter ATP-binding protein [Fusibacter sp. 3D3]GAU79570.1 putrescine transport ATP-binding protein PotA [Fusibacter sp. 3D3]
MAFVKVNHLTKYYGTIKVFEDLDFEIQKGEFITLLGPSGCGKSTLLRAIAGLTEVGGGQILINDRDVTHMAPKQRNVTMVFQSYALFPNMTVGENIGFGLKMKGLNKKEIAERVNRFIDLVELTGREDAYPFELSGGQQQRVALARALVVEPDVLLLDEPLSALDAKIRKSLRLQIRKIQKALNITTIFVTHDQEEALIVSDRIFLMEGGQFAQIGTPENVYVHPESEFAARFIGNYNVLTEVELKKLNNKIEGQGLYAIRPEAIELTLEMDTAHAEGAKGIVKDAIVLGNVIRYTIVCNEIHLTVDVLNKGHHIWLKPGSDIRITIPAHELKKVA